MNYNNNFHDDYDEEDITNNYYDGTVKENKCKDHPDKKSGCNINNHINFCAGHTKNDCIDYKPRKHKKQECCCDTTRLREMLLIFKQNNTPVILFTETLPAVGGDFLTSKYIHAIINDMVYVSTISSSGPVVYIIPLCNISFVIAIPPTLLTDLSNLIRRLMTEKTTGKDPCCCTSGIGNTLNSLSNVNLLLPLSGGFYSISSSPNSLLVLIVFFLYTLFLLGLGAISTVANDDIYVIYSESAAGSFYLIVPTCKIDVLVIPQNLGTTNGLQASSALSSPILSTLLSLLTEDMQAKIKKLDMDKFAAEIKGKSMDEILAKIKSIIG